MDHPPLVVDMGSHTVKSGLSSSGHPTLFPSSLSCQHLHDLPRRDIMWPFICDPSRPGAGGGEHPSPSPSPSSSPPSPASLDPSSQPHEMSLLHREISDWEKVERLWERCFREAAVTPESTLVLGMEGPETPRRNKEGTVELLFERLRAGGYYPALQGVMGLYALGKTTGVVLESGDVMTYVFPVADGYAIPHAIARHDFAGHDVTIYLASLLKEKGVNFTGAGGFETVQSIKEEHAFISGEFKEEFSPSRLSQIERSFPLPDGNLLTLGSERFRCAEILFQPSILGRDTPGLAELLFSSILRCDIDLRLGLYSNLVLSGGNTLFPGMEERLAREIRELAPSTVRSVVVAPKERRTLAWRGGAVFAGMEGFQKICISREQYNEVGSNVVFRMQL